MKKLFVDYCMLDIIILLKKKNTIPLFINITLIFKIKKLISTIMSDKYSKNIKIYFLESFDK
jgi:hypothetical protein